MYLCINIYVFRSTTTQSQKVSNSHMNLIGSKTDSFGQFECTIPYTYYC
jgi:hypothetical protein